MTIMKTRAKAPVLSCTTVHFLPCIAFSVYGRPPPNNAADVLQIVRLLRILKQADKEFKVSGRCCRSDVRSLFSSMDECGIQKIPGSPLRLLECP